MPLVVLCGFPACGKSTRAQQIVQHIAAEYPSKTVHVVTDHSEGVSRNKIYSDSIQEREFRGNLKSSVQRLLNKNDVVILDSLNYIKGFRYELYCLTKACRTPHCVVYCVTDDVTSKSWNLSRDESERYDDSLMAELIQRFESPVPSNRWDKPLISVINDEPLDLNSVCSALFEQKAAPPNQSTQSQPLSSTNFLYEIDKITQNVITTIMEAQKMAVPGDCIKVDKAKEEFVYTRSVTLAEIQRHRRQFISYTKSHPVSDTYKLSTLFIQYLNTAVNT